MAQDDKVFDPIMRVTDSMKTMDRGYFKTRDRYDLPRNLDESIHEQPVFRKIRQNKKRDIRNGAPLFCVSEKSLSYGSAYYSSKKAARSAEYLDFTFYSLRRAAANSLDRATITEDQRRAAVGHRGGTCTFLNNYMSKHTHIDLQGLVAHGKEYAPALKAPGLRRVVKACLTSSDLAEVEKDVNVTRHRLEMEKVSRVYTACIK